MPACYSRQQPHPHLHQLPPSQQQQQQRFSFASQESLNSHQWQTYGSPAMVDPLFTHSSAATCNLQPVTAAEGHGQSGCHMEQPQQQMGPVAAAHNLSGTNGEQGHWGPEEVKQLLEALGEHNSHIQHCQTTSYQQQVHARDEEVDQEALLSRSQPAVELRTAGSGIVGGLGTLAAPTTIMPVQQTAQQGYHQQGPCTLHMI